MAGSPVIGRRMWDPGPEERFRPPDFPRLGSIEPSDHVIVHAPMNADHPPLQPKQVGPAFSIPIKPSVPHPA